MLLGIIGGALIFAWDPTVPQSHGRPDRHRDSPAGSSPTAGQNQPTTKTGRPRTRHHHARPRRAAQQHHTRSSPPHRPHPRPRLRPADWWWPWDQWFNRGGNEQSEPQTPPERQPPPPRRSQQTRRRAQSPPRKTGEPRARRRSSRRRRRGRTTKSRNRHRNARSGLARRQEVTEEEFLDAVEACQHAAETGDLPRSRRCKADASPPPQPPAASPRTASS